MIRKERDSSYQDAERRLGRLSEYSQEWLCHTDNVQLGREVAQAFLLVSAFFVTGTRGRVRETW